MQMDTKMLPTVGVGQQFFHPFNNMIYYYLISLCLCALILVGLIILEKLYNRFSLMTRVYTMMFEVKKRRLYCFNVDISSTSESRVICEASKWVLRIAVVSILCYLWQSCFLFETTLQFQGAKERDDWTEELCEQGLFCVHHETSWGMFAKFFRPHPGTACDSVATYDKGFLTCAGIPVTDALRFAVHFGISYSLFRLIINSYQLVAWLLYRARGRRLHIGVIVLTILLTLLWIVGVSSQFAGFTNTWFASVGYFSIPLILLCGRVTGLQTRNRHLVHYKEAVQGLPLILQKANLIGGSHATDALGRQVFHEDVSTALGLSNSRALKAVHTTHNPILPVGNEMNNRHYNPGNVTGTLQNQNTMTFRKSASDLIVPGPVESSNNGGYSKSERKTATASSSSSAVTPNKKNT